MNEENAKDARPINHILSVNNSRFHVVKLLFYWSQSFYCSKFLYELIVIIISILGPLFWVRFRLARLCWPLLLYRRVSDLVISFFYTCLMGSNHNKLSSGWHSMKNQQIPENYHQQNVPTLDSSTNHRSFWLAPFLCSSKS